MAAGRPARGVGARPTPQAAAAAVDRGASLTSRLAAPADLTEGRPHEPALSAPPCPLQPAPVAGAGVVAVLATSLGQAPLAVGHGRRPRPRRAGSPRPAAPPVRRTGGLPIAIEPLAAYVPAASSCDTATSRAASRGRAAQGDVPRHDVRDLARCGSDALPTSEHYDGRAVDWITNVRTVEGKARGNALVNWLTAKDARGTSRPTPAASGSCTSSGTTGSGAPTTPQPAGGPTPPAPPTRARPATRRATATTCTSPSPGRARCAARRGGPRPWRQDFGPCRVPDLNWAAAYSAANPVRCPSYPKV